MLNWVKHHVVSESGLHQVEGPIVFEIQSSNGTLGCFPKPRARVQAEEECSRNGSQKCTLVRAYELLQPIHLISGQWWGLLEPPLGRVHGMCNPLDTAGYHGHLTLAIHTEGIAEEVPSFQEGSPHSGCSPLRLQVLEVQVHIVFSGTERPSVIALYLPNSPSVEVRSPL